ncbi:MAG: hypothetical protein NXI28_20875 [bacterium]|nr:hypothetical protein [bacterium]
MTSERRNIRLPRVALATRILFASFLSGTGIMTMGFALNGYPVGETPDDVGRFMIALEQTGYLIFWVGLFKTVAGGLMFFSRTAPLAVLMSLPYVVNILLYVTFFAHQYLAIGIPDFAACALLTYCYFHWYRPIFAGPTKQTAPANAPTSTPSAADHAF